MIVDFNNLAAHEFNFSDVKKTQGWENYFNHLKGPTFPDLAKEFWANAFILDAINVCSNVRGHKIFICEVDVAKLLQHDNSGVRCHNNREARLIRVKSNY